MSKPKVETGFVCQQNKHNGTQKNLKDDQLIIDQRSLSNVDVKSDHFFPLNFGFIPQSYCGGFGVQFGRNGGKCGICGDR